MRVFVATVKKLRRTQRLISPVNGFRRYGLVGHSEILLRSLPTELSRQRTLVHTEGEKEQERGVLLAVLHVLHSSERL